jgi:hypothetical protein
MADVFVVSSIWFTVTKGGKELSSPLLGTQFSPQPTLGCADELANLSHADF